MPTISSAWIHASSHVESIGDDGLATFLRVRPRLFGIAYRMLGSSAAAEDVVQDAWVRWQVTDRESVRDAAAFLATTTTRLAINVMQSARSRHETCAEAWMPEPVDTGSDQTLRTERADALALAVVILLERLSPAERAAYILREAFDYSYRAIADILRLREANARQLVTRARQHVVEGPRAAAHAAAQCRLLTAFSAAAQGGDAAGLVDLLAREGRPSGRRQGTSVGAASGSEVLRLLVPALGGIRRASEITQERRPI